MLVLSDLHKRYGHVRALDGLSLRAQPGRILGFLGPNGAGKTTAMRAVFGLVGLESGHVQWDGHPVGPEQRLRFGYMPEQRGLYPRMAAGPQLTYLGRLHGLTRQEAESAARHWLDTLGLGDRFDAPVQQLSHGNQQRVQLAAALSHDPQLLVLDEPFNGLDPLGVTAMSEVLTNRAAAGATVVFSSHQLDLVESLCDDVAIIVTGRDQLSGSLEEVRATSGQHRVDVRLAGGAPPPVPDGVEEVARRDGTVTWRVPRDLDPQAVLAAVSRGGTVERFSFTPPSLSEVFRDTVGASIEALEAQAAAPGPAASGQGDHQAATDGRDRQGGAA